MFCFYFVCLTGNIAIAVLQEAAEMTISTALNNRESTHTDAHISTEKEGMQRERSPKERAEVEAEGEANQGEDREKDKEEKKDSLTDESLRMASWVEVDNESSSAEENSKVEMAGKAEEARGVMAEQVLLEAQGRSMGEAEKEQTLSVEEELAMMEEKWREQCAINETLKQRLANEEERFRVQMAERASEVTELKRNLTQALRDKEQLQEVKQHAIYTHMAGLFPLQHCCFLAGISSV